MCTDPVTRAPAVLLLALALPLPASANGGGSLNRTESPLPAIEARIEAGEHAPAIRDLEALLDEDPRSADVLNLLGFAHRHAGRLDVALDYYQRALAIEPEHLGANEYLGELYLQREQLEQAESRLAVLDSACFFGCEEYDELKEAIAAFRRARGL